MTNSIITKHDLKCFDHARSISLLADYINSKSNSRIRIGCVAVYGNKIISTGFNADRTHPLQAKYNQYRNFNNKESAVHKLHAEIMCLAPLIVPPIKFEINWNKVKLYIYRSCKDRETGNARPCPACMQLIMDQGVKHIYYTTDIGYAYENLSTTDVQNYDIAL
jgi:deoxycytidylate deaminase